MAERWQHPNRRDPQTLPEELRRVSVSRRLLDWAEQIVGTRVARVTRLTGASSTAVHVLRLEGGVAVVLRSYVWPGFLAEEPDAPQREVDALRWARRAGLPAPEVIGFDPTGTASGVPALVMERLPGRAIGGPPVERLAELAAQVHAVSAAGLGHDWFPWCRATSTRPPDGATDKRVWERAHELWRQSPPPYAATFVHRDLHPGNVLWRRGRPTGLVDWANACQGPSGVDVATCRWNLEDWADESAAARFVAEYERLTGLPQHPYWQLASVLEDDWDLGKPVQVVRRAERRLSRILAAY